MRIRVARRGDETSLFGLIGELAEYERLSDALRGDADLLAKALFEREAAEALIAEVGADCGWRATGCGGLAARSRSSHGSERADARLVLALPDAPLAWLRMEPAGEWADVRLAAWPGGEDRHLARVGYHGSPVELIAAQSQA